MLSGSLIVIVLSKRIIVWNIFFGLCLPQNPISLIIFDYILAFSDAPDAPTSLEVKELGSRQIQLLWKLPFSGNAAISQCTVQWRSDNGLWHDSATVGGDERQATIRGLKPTTKYWFKVRCQNMFGVSEFSNEYEIVTSEERKLSSSKKLIGLSPLIGR